MPLIIPQLVYWGVSPSRREKEDGPSRMGVRLTEAIPAPVVWEGREVSPASKARKAFATAGSDNREVMLSHAFPES